MNFQNPSDYNSELFSRFMEVVRNRQSLHYAHLTPGLVVSETSDKFSVVLEEEIDEPLGMPITEVLWEFVGLEADLQKVLHGVENEFRLERVHRTLPNGEQSYLDFIVKPIHEAYPAKGLILIVEDVSESGKLEQALVQDRNELRLAQSELAKANAELKRLNRLQALFLTVTAHDIRTPLTGISGYSELVLSGKLGEVPEQVREYLRIIHLQTDYLNHITGDLLDLESLEQGNLSLHLEQCNLVEAVKGVCELMHFNAQRNNLSMLLDLPSEPVLVYADPNRIEQVLYNLISNAIKYTPSGGEIHVRVGEKDANGFFSVQDTGEGIPLAEQKQLFELHYRTEGARYSKVRGIGLGLFIVKSLVDAHNGIINVDSKPGQGTKFTVQIPLSQIN